MFVGDWEVVSKGSRRAARRVQLPVPQFLPPLIRKKAGISPAPGG